MSSGEMRPSTTITDGPGRNRKERKQKTYNKMQGIDVNGPCNLSLIVKTADRLANLEESVSDKKNDKISMYVKEHDQFKGAVFRPNLCDELWDKTNQTK